MADARTRLVEYVAASGLILLGAALRLRAIQTISLSSDVLSYVPPSREWTLTDPWHASWREPGVIAAYKLFAAPLGYRLGSAQVLTFVTGMGACVVYWRLARRRGRVAGITALAVTTLAPALATSVAIGTRDTLGLLAVGVALLLVDDGRLLAAAVVAASTVSVRPELGLLLLAVTAAASVAAKRWRPILTGLALAAVVMGPFMWNNAQHFGDPLYSSKVHVSATRNMELARKGLPTPTGDVSLPHDDVRRADYFAGPTTGWDSFYMDVLGPGESVRRVIAGFVYYMTLLLGHTFTGSDFATWPIGAWALAGLAIIGVRDPTTRAAAFVAVVGVLGFAALYLLDPGLRLTSFALGPLSFLIGSGVERLRAASHANESGRGQPQQFGRSGPLGVPDRRSLRARRD